MAKFDYNRVQTTVRSLLNKFGTIQTVTRTTKGTYDPVTETFSSETVVTETADGVLVGIDDSFKDNSLVKQSDSMLLVLDISEPQADDVFTVNGKDYKYIVHKTISPIGTVCLYKVVLRV